MRLRMIGQRDMRGACPHSGIRCCCMGVRRMRLRNGHPSLGWLTNDRLSFRCSIAYPFWPSPPTPRFISCSVLVSPPLTFSSELSAFSCRFLFSFAKYYDVHGFLRRSPAMSHVLPIVVGSCSFINVPLKSPPPQYTGPGLLSIQSIIINDADDFCVSLYEIF